MRQHLTIQFQDRLGRRQFAQYLVISVLIALSPSLLYVLSLIIQRLADISGDSGVATLFAFLFFLLAFGVAVCFAVYFLSLCVRRTRDIGISPWWSLLVLLPYLGLIYLLVLAVWPSRRRTVEEGAVEFPTPLITEHSDDAALAAAPTDPPLTPDIAPVSLGQKLLRGFGVLIVLILVGGATRGLGGVLREQFDSRPTTTAQELLTDDTFREYVASDFGFNVHFPGFPERDDQTMDVQGYDVPYTVYMREIEGGKKAYMAAVYDYRGAALDPSQLNLEGALNGMAQGMDATLDSTSSAVLGNEAALEGRMTANVEGTAYPGYARLMVRDMRMYAVLTVGSDYAQFDAFADSFAFVQ
jgi:uncharacterized membrane protein YhaH (DUF805 family)